MAKASRYAFTDFAVDESIILQIGEGDGGKKFRVAQMTTSFPINGIPQATVLLAIGRDARNTNARAAIHEAEDQFVRMEKAKIIGRFTGQHIPDQDWPDMTDEPLTLFDGYLSGFTYRKLQGKVYAAVHINHWLIDLTLSSCLNSTIHPRSAGDLRAKASAPSSTGSGGNTGGDQRTVLTGTLWRPILTAGLINGDFWGNSADGKEASGLQGMIASIARQEQLSGQFKLSATTVLGDIPKNDRALRALERIEGPEYELGGPLEFSQTSAAVRNAIGDAISMAANNMVTHNNVWDLLVGGLAPMLGFEIWPLINTALIVPSVPAYRDSNWRTVGTNEMVAIDSNTQIPKPLRAVMVYGGMGADALGYSSESASVLNNGLTGIAGHGEDGTIILTKPPPWLAAVPALAAMSSDPGGDQNNDNFDTATTPGSGGGGGGGGELTEDDYKTVRELLDGFADGLYVQNVLRGRTGTLTGRLRWDIGPGSHIKIEGSPEQFIGGEDQLGGNIYAQVHRTTISINAEGDSPQAVTSFGLSYIRSEAENEDDATSLEEPPFYSKASMIQGAPLLAELALDPNPGPGGNANAADAATPTAATEGTGVA